MPIESPPDLTARCADVGRPSTVQRVLMTADAVGGVWTYAVDLARALGARGTRVTLAVIGPAPSEAQRAEARAIPTLDLREHPGRLEWMDDPWADVARRD